MVRGTTCELIVNATMSMTRVNILGKKALQKGGIPYKVQHLPVGKSRVQNIIGEPSKLRRKNLKKSHFIDNISAFSIISVHD